MKGDVAYLASAWHGWFQALIRALYYSRITVHGREHLPSQGPLLLVMLHRNGAVDGFVYRALWPEICYTLKANLRKSLLGRVFFDGLEIVRNHDGSDAEENRAVIAQCVQVLRQGAGLGIFPEGTSKLGPAHLPFRSGAARIAQQYLSERDELRVLPCGIHYERGWAFRSRVEIVIGPPIALEASDSLGAIRRKFTAALEEVGANFPDAATQQLAERVAYAATLGMPHSYAKVLQQCAAGIPEEIRLSYETWEKRCAGRRLWRHQGVPLFPLRSVALYALAALVLSAVVLPGVVVQCVPLGVAATAGKVLADDTNVIALWRILTGVPLALLWNVALAAVLVWAGAWWWLLAPWAFSYGMWFFWYRWKKTMVVAMNGICHWDLREAAIEWHASVVKALGL
jgi:1-acyl-sn-glycerol-3-phosphate acyltransferase